VHRDVRFVPKADKLLTRDEARRIAANAAKLPVEAFRKIINND
jgi:hypothetical protein